MKETNNKVAGDREKLFLMKSSLYQEFLAERNEILRLKWVESEKAGEDIGFERALLNWVRNHRADWKSERKMPDRDNYGKGISDTSY